jgi:FG-GAP-like repeat
MKRASLLPVRHRRCVALLPLFLAANLTHFAPAQPVQLMPAQVLYASGAPLAPGSYAIPCVADWNGDGRKDLIVGYQSAGKLALFLNTGSDASPVFTNFVNLQAGGVDIVHTSGGCGAPAPFVCDYDGDGNQDLLVGTGQEGYVYFYRNLSTDAAPILAPGVPLMVGSSPLTVSYRATPFLYDWDGDGLKDLLCGNGDGYVFFFKNIGTAQAPVYAPGIRIQAGGTDLNLGIRSVVRMFDWDGDGVKDLVGSSDAGVYWCKNVGTDTAPILQATVAIRAPVSGSGLVPIAIGPRMRLDLVDWNNDGAIDLLVGNYSGTVTFYEGYRFAFTQTACSPAGQQVCQWNSAPYLSYQVFAGASVNSITNLVATNLASGGTTTRWTNSTTSSLQFYRLKIGQ